MLISLIRTVMLLIVVIAALRIMGKRQIGQLQPSELVITILLSEIAATPMQDNDIPLMNTVISILCLVGIEIILSVISMKSVRVRSVLQGNSLIIIRDGVLDVSQITRLRYTLDDILEALRQKDVFDIADVQYAVAETDGSLSVLLKPGKRTVSVDYFDKNPEDNGIPCVVVSDGEIIRSDFKDCGMTEEKLNKIIKKTGLPVTQIMLLTVDKAGNTNLIKKEKKK